MSERFLYLIRHGATAGIGLNGHNDVDVVPRGTVDCLGQTEAIFAERLISSDLRRAVTCADAIGHAKGLPVEYDARWRELNFGDWDGYSITDIGWDSAKAFWSDPEANPPPGGERWSQIVARVEDALHDIEDGDTLVVTHSGAMKAALHILCGFDLEQLWGFQLNFSSMLGLQLWPGERPGERLRGQIMGLWP